MFDRRRLVLRRYEVQMQYHAAYLFWNTQGLLAERWAHGPHFNGYSRGPEHVQLTQGTDQSRTLIGVYGIKASAFLWERPESLRDTEKLALEWFEDVLAVLQPQRVTQLTIRILNAYPVPDRERISEVMARQFPEAAELAPPGYEAVHPGVSFNAHRLDRKGVETIITASFGAYGPDQAEDVYLVAEPDEWGLGCFYSRRAARKEGLVGPKDLLREELKTASKEASQLVNQTISRVMNIAA